MEMSLQAYSPKERDCILGRLHVTSTLRLGLLRNEGCRAIFLSYIKIFLVRRLVCQGVPSPPVGGN